jgi:hypothetical protein
MSAEGADSWQERFSSRLVARQQARMEQRRDFQAYIDWVAQLFDRIAGKVAGIEQITMQRPMVLRTGEFRDHVSGQVEMIKSMALRCESRMIEFVPEGINFAFGKGRLRLVHKVRGMPEFVYLYLVNDPTSPESYPSNLRWVINDGGEQQPPDKFPPFDEQRIEQLIERAFLND